MRTEINHATASQFIENYLAYSDQPLEDWDIDMAANILVDRCYENSGWGERIVDDYDDIDSDLFVEIMKFSRHHVDLKDVWDLDNVTITGWDPDYNQTIDKDQAVDEDGKACYRAYHFTFNGTCPEQTQIFLADDMEEFAKTW